MKINNHKNSIISNFVRENCSPVRHERKFAQDEFYFLNKILIGSIFQSGSYARFTSISPLNDLDAQAEIVTDSDNDGLSDDMEKVYGTDPNKADTDGDGYNDGDEVNGGFNPNGAGKLL